MYDLLGRSLKAVAITGNRLESLTDRGDGILVLIKPHDEVPKTVLLGRLIPLLAALLVEYNAQAPHPALRMRLRVVMHAGEVHMDRRGCYGEAIDIAIRLLDSPRVKKTLKQATAPLVLVISNEIYSGIVCQGYVDPETYHPLVRVGVGKRRHRGWVHIPPTAAPVLAGPVRRLRPATRLIGPRDRGRAGGIPGGRMSGASHFLLSPRPSWAAGTARARCRSRPRGRGRRRWRGCPR